MVEEAPDIRPGRPAVDARRQAAQRPAGHRRRQRLAVAIVGALVLVVVGILVAGYVIIFVFPPQQLVVRVDDVSYSRGDMVKLLRLRQATVQATGGVFNSGEDVFEALQLIVENEIIAQAAPRFGLSVPRQEIRGQGSERGRLPPQRRNPAIQSGYLSAG